MAKSKKNRKNNAKPKRSKRYKRRNAGKNASNLHFEQLESRQLLTTVGFNGDFVLDNWTAETIPNGTTTISPDSGSADQATFGFNVELPPFSGSFAEETADFLVPSTVTGSVSFDYEFSGNSRYFQAEAQFDTIVGGTPTSIVDASSTSGPFTYTGSASFIAQNGQDFGFRIGGGHQDSNRNIFGNLTITNLVISDSIVVDSLADVDDGDHSTGNLTLREAIGLANTIPGADTITFDSSLSSLSLIHI